MEFVKRCKILVVLLLIEHHLLLWAVANFWCHSFGYNDTSYNDASHNNTSHNDTWHNNTSHNETSQNDTSFNDNQHYVTLNDYTQPDTRHNGTQHYKITLLGKMTLCLTTHGVTTLRNMTLSTTIKKRHSA
jgi:hypothetical protein